MKKIRKPKTHLRTSVFYTLYSLPIYHLRASVFYTHYPLAYLGVLYYFPVLGQYRAYGGMVKALAYMLYGRVGLKLSEWP